MPFIHTSTAYTISAFYKFIPLPDFETMKEPLLEAMKTYNIKGTIILASEGINGSFCGEEASIAEFIAILRQYDALADLTFCDTFSDANPFEKAKVKLRKEIVTMGKEDVSPLDMKGEYLSPLEWNQIQSDPDVLFIDTRNGYEYSLGTFEGAINPKTDNFRDFPEYVKEHLMDKKDKKIAMFCTGGIRCEKSTAYLKKMGFDKVFHLQGGILNYLASVPSESSFWKGSCFVFDERVALDHQLQGLPRGTIDTEWKNKNRQASEK